MIEKSWKAIAPVAVTATGTKYGELTVASTKGFKAKQKVVLSHPVNGKVELEVRRVNSSTKLELGELQTPFDKRADLTGFDNTCTLSAKAQPRNSIPEDQIDRAIYEEEPTVATRVIPVDRYGDIVDDQNPLPVKLPPGSIQVDNISVKLTHEDDDPSLGDIHDSVRVGDGTHELNVNPDGSINVHVIEGSVVDDEEEVLNIFNEEPAVTGNVNTILVSYTVPAGKIFCLSKVEAGGENIAAYEVYVDGNLEARRRTYYASGFVTDFSFEAEPSKSLRITENKVIEVKVLHTRPQPAVFEARILGNLLDET